MRPKKINYGMTLVEILISLGISAFMLSAIFGLLANTLLHTKLFGDVNVEWQKHTRMVTLIESRVVNAGFGIPSSEKVEDVFRAPSGRSTLSGWTDVLEILTSKDIPVSFQNIGGEQIARGERMRVLSTHAATANVRLIPASAEFGPHKIRTVNIRKPQNESLVYPIEFGDLSSWITTPSFGRPVIIRSVFAPYASNTGTVELQNPLSVSKDWHGIDMFHTFRIAYFSVEAETLYIRDSAKSIIFNKQPVVDDVLSACFELNKTTKILRCWFLIRNYRPSAKPGIPNEWPVWAIIHPKVLSNNLKVVSHSWHLINI